MLVLVVVNLPNQVVEENMLLLKNKKLKSKQTILKKPRATPFIKLEDIVNYAKKFEGVRYRYGGTTRKGMDCSGLINTAFKSEGISLPRTTKDLAITGDWIDLKQVKKGDLLFFATRKIAEK